MTKVVALREPKGVQRFGVPIPEGMEIDFIQWPCSDEELKAALKDADVLWCGPVDIINKDVIDSAKNLKLIQSLGVGFDKIDLEASKANGVYVCNNRAVNAASVAEHAVGLMLACLKTTAVIDNKIKNGGYHECFDHFKKNGHVELGSRTVGLIGFGAIGKKACDMLNAFGAKIMYYDVIRPDAETEKLHNLTYGTLDELYEKCDILSYHVPVLDSTRGMVNKDTIAKMKENVIIVNVARGEIVNNEDLRDALNAGRVYAGLDVIAPEPPSEDHPLLNLTEVGNEHLTITPHIAGTTDDAFKRMVQWSYDNMIAVVNGEKPKNVVNGL
ncbi:MAG: 2-hydroxyacid dehydrogenase [Eubacteriales bacterium]|nr:2-hydroxyacid dehydrogenase [Eubacteriales bacterium]MDY3333009.1 2-hydroxyacid dehydrogenase [Gallibacter sp.]